MPTSLYTYMPSLRSSRRSVLNTTFLICHSIMETTRWLSPGRLSRSTSLRRVTTSPPSTPTAPVLRRARITRKSSAWHPSKPWRKGLSVGTSSRNSSRPRPSWDHWAKPILTMTSAEFGITDLQGLESPVLPGRSTQMPTSSPSPSGGTVIRVRKLSFSTTWIREEHALGTTLRYGLTDTPVKGRLKAITLL